jgi:hypothetical protein
MEDNIKKQELHLVRLEQCIKQVQKLKAMGVPDEKIDARIDDYLDRILETKKRIKELKESTQEDAD